MQVLQSWSLEATGRHNAAKGYSFPSAVSHRLTVHISYTYLPTMF